MLLDEGGGNLDFFSFFSTFFSLSLAWVVFCSAYHFSLFPSAKEEKKLIFSSELVLSLQKNKSYDHCFRIAIFFAFFLKKRNFFFSLLEGRKKKLFLSTADFSSTLDFFFLSIFFFFFLLLLTSFSSFHFSWR